MSKVKTISSMLAASVVTAAVVATPVLAWHPKGEIKKFVQNTTTASALSDANDTDTAVAAKPGDVLKYVIEVSNTGNDGQTNEMYFTKLTDNLPDGVELVSDPSMRKITEDLGVIAPGQKVTRQYLVKVVSTTDGQVIKNTACFTGDSEVKDNKQSGCDVANVKVTVPVTPPEQPKTPVTPTPPAPTTPKPETPVKLPDTGSVEILGGLAGAGTVGYATVHYLRSKRNLRKSHNR